MRIIMKSIFYISKKKTNKKGCAPIYCRITCNGQRSEFSTGIFVSATDFKFNYGVTETTKENVLINSQLAKIKSEINTIYLHLCLRDACFSSNTIKDLFLGEKKQVSTLNELLQEFKTKRLAQCETTGNYKTVKAKLNNLLDYFTSQHLLNVSIQAFTSDVVKKFYLFLVEKYSIVYARRILEVMQEAFKYAISEQYISNSPVINFKPLYKDVQPKIVTLTPDELAQLKKTNYKKNGWRIANDLYIFQSYTGLSYIDVIDFNYSRDVMLFNGKEFIYRYRKKGTKGETIVPLFSDAKKVLQKYNYELPKLSLDKYNEYIQEIAKDLKIEKHLTTHTARKTFATIKLNEGFTIESVAKMLGHTSTKITQSTYAQVNHLRILNEMNFTGIR